MRFPFERVQHLLIDLDGVIYRGNAPLPGAKAFVAWLRDEGLTFRLVTNNATLTPEEYAEKLARMGIEVRPDEVFTSALATALYLRDRGQSRARAFVIGQSGIRQALTGIGITITPENPDWVVVGLDRELTYEKLALAALALERGARFLGTNPDKSFPTERGLEPGAGAILAALQATTGKDPITIGKPQPLMLELAMRHMNADPASAAMLGDRLDTDIAAAEAAGIPAILVLTGVSTKQEVAHSPYHPTLIVDSLPELIEKWRGGVSQRR